VNTIKGELVSNSDEADQMNRPIRFKYDSSKATQAILWLLHKHGRAMDKLKLVKLIFYADREHLSRFGRPIVGGSYVAMRHGPVSSELLDNVNFAAEGKGLPFQLVGTTVTALSSVNEDELSESDIQVLDRINSLHGNRDTFALRDLTHNLRAWSKNYPNPTDNTSRPLPYEDFFLDLEDKEMLEVIREHQEAMGF